jgi:hypothetical protein
MANELGGAQEQLQAGVAEEHGKRVKLCELLLLVLGIEPCDIDSGTAFVDHLVQNVAQDLDVLSSALAQAATEDSRTPSVVAQLADRLRYGLLAARQVHKLLPELQKSGAIRRPEQG